MKRIAFVFPGQGSQSVGMLAGFDGNAAVAQTMETADQALGFSIRSMIENGPAADLNLTLNTQPAMLASSVAFYRAWCEAGGARPAVMAGHSLGEYSALCAAGVFSLQDAVSLVRYRAQVMQNAVPVGVGGMAAIIGLDDETVIEACREASVTGPVEAVNFNSPGQVVIAGEKAALAKAVELLKAKGARRAVVLPVSAPFHSSMLKPAALELAGRLAKTPMQPAQVPVYANVTAALHGTDDEIRAHLAEQVASPVQWVKIIKAMQDSGVTDIVECGPGRVLTGLLRRTAPSISGHNIYDAASLEKTLEALAN